jgi:hypothetical protein
MNSAASKRPMGVSHWKEPEAVADKVLKRAEVSKVSLNPPLDNRWHT